MTGSIRRQVPDLGCLCSLIIALLSGAALAADDPIHLSGTLVRDDGRPANGCELTLKQAGNVLKTSGGTFDFSGATPVRPSAARGPGPEYLRGNIFYFTTRPSDPTSLKILDLAGRRISTILESTLPEGEYGLYPQAFLPPGRTTGHFILVAQGGGKVRRYAFVADGRTAPPGITPMFHHSGSLAKAAVDTLVVACSECRKKEIAIERYDAPLGKIALSAESPAALEDVVFAVRTLEGPHWYENYSRNIKNSPTWGTQGKLVKLNLRTKAYQILVNDPGGTVRDPQVHYDGTKIIFAYRKNGEDQFHLWEINADGTGLKQLTRGPFDDFEPTYLPNGNIIFTSSRGIRYVPCWYTQVSILYKCDANGNDVRPLSSNPEHDNTPWMLPDGRVMYTRWEYTERSREDFHQLWFMNPDGTGQMTLFGNMHPTDLLIDAKPIPGTSEILAINSPRHGQMEHMGRVSIVRTDKGPDDLSAQTLINTGSLFRDPYPVSKDSFLVAQEDKLMLMNRAGQAQELFALTAELAANGGRLHEPRPIQPRAREKVLPDKTNRADSLGQIMVMDIYLGRNMAGIPRGSIKKLLFIENLNVPVGFTGSMDPISFGGSYMINRVLGTVPVEPDGSVNAKVPPLRSLQMIALDENNLSVKRMVSFFTIQPGEMISCTGCHEDRTMAVPNLPNLMALQRQPSRITPVPGVPEIFDYPRDIQPILDANCVSCHDEKTYQGKVLLTGGNGPVFTNSYFVLSSRLQMADGRDLARGNYPPYKNGSSASYLMKKVDGSHHGVTLPAPDLLKIKTWLDAAATFPGTYASEASGMLGSYASLEYGTKTRIDFSSWPELAAAKAAMDRRCNACHTGNTALPQYPDDRLGVRLHHLVYDKGTPRFWDPPWIRTYGDGSKRPGTTEWMKAFAAPGLLFNRNLVYNLTEPDKSIQLRAPLAKAAGGLEICKAGGVFANKQDADYVILLAGIQRAKAWLDQNPRFNMPDFRPEAEYIREMKRYGFLPATHQDKDPIDVYAVEKRYWESQWHKPTPIGTSIRRPR